MWWGTGDGEWLYEEGTANYRPDSNLLSQILEEELPPISSEAAGSLRTVSF